MCQLHTLIDCSSSMDQAASVISMAASALYVTFFPSLAAKLIPVPGSSPSLPPSSRAVFICANSLVVSDKVVHAPTRYNLRVVETLVGARILAVRLGLKLDEGDGREKITLREVLGRMAGEQPGKELNTEDLEGALKKMIQEVEVLKPQNVNDGQLGVTLTEMIELSHLSEPEFHQLYLSWVHGEPCCAL